jgi:hypothetical protein
MLDLVDLFARNETAAIAGRVAEVHRDLQTTHAHYRTMLEKIGNQLGHLSEPVVSFCQNAPTPETIDLSVLGRFAGTGDRFMPRPLGYHDDAESTHAREKHRPRRSVTLVVILPEPDDSCYGHLMALPCLAFCPYLHVRKPTAIADWEIGPLDGFADRWADEKFRKQSEAFLGKFVDENGKPIEHPPMSAECEDRRHACWRK